MLRHRHTPSATTSPIEHRACSHGSPGENLHRVDDFIRGANDPADLGVEREQRTNSDQAFSRNLMIAGYRCPCPRARRTPEPFQRRGFRRGRCRPA